LFYISGAFICIVTNEAAIIWWFQVCSQRTGIFQAVAWRLIHGTKHADAGV